MVGGSEQACLYTVYIFLRKSENFDFGGTLIGSPFLRIDKNDYSYYVWGGHLPLYTNFYANLRILILGVPGGTLIGAHF